MSGWKLSSCAQLLLVVQLACQGLRARQYQLQFVRLALSSCLSVEVVSKLLKRICSFRSNLLESVIVLFRSKLFIRSEEHTSELQYLTTSRMPSSA